MTRHCFLRPIRRDLTSSSYTTLNFNFSHFIPQIKLFFKIKFSDSKIRWNEDSEKFSLTFFGENSTEALVISKRLKLP